MNFGLLNCADPCVNFGLLNARSAVHKVALIHDVLSDHHLDLAAVTETWMLSDEPDAVKLDIALAGYRVLHACRGSSTDIHRGGGVAIIHRESIYYCLLSISDSSASSNICQLDCSRRLRRRRSHVSTDNLDLFPPRSVTNCPICSISCYFAVGVRSSAAFSTALAKTEHRWTIDYRRCCRGTISCSW